MQRSVLEHSGAECTLRYTCWLNGICIYILYGTATGECVRCHRQDRTGEANPVREEQAENALEPIVCNVGGNFISLRELQLEKVLLPIDVTPLGIVTLVRPVHPFYLQITLYQ